MVKQYEIKTDGTMSSNTGGKARAVRRYPKKPSPTPSSACRAVAKNGLFHPRARRTRQRRQRENGYSEAKAGLEKLSFKVKK